MIQLQIQCRPADSEPHTRMPAKRPRIQPEHLEHARQLRRESTIPERLLWSRLRDRRLAGLKFRRQHQIAPFIVDFCCPAQMLVVELDGLSHVGRGAADDARTKRLAAKGYRVLRVTNDDVLSDVDAVAQYIGREMGLSS